MRRKAPGDVRRVRRARSENEGMLSTLCAGRAGCPVDGRGSGLDSVLAGATLKSLGYPRHAALAEGMRAGARAQLSLRREEGLGKTYGGHQWRPCA